MNTKATEHLTFALEQYRNNLGGVADYVEKAKDNLEKAQAHQADTLNKISELEEILGVESVDSSEEVSTESTESTQEATS